MRKQESGRKRKECDGERERRLKEMKALQSKSYCREPEKDRVLKQGRQRKS